MSNQASFAGAAHNTVSVDTVIIPTAGWGTRMAPFTNAIPKNLLPVGDRQLIDIAVESAVAAGAKKIVMVCSPRDMAAYQSHFSPPREISSKVESKPELKARVEAVTQYAPIIEFVAQEQARGLGHAVLMGKDHVSGPFGVILPDNLMLGKDGAPTMYKELVDNYTDGVALACMEVAAKDTNKYGIFKLEDGQDENAKSRLAVSVVEKPAPDAAPSRLAVMGLYVCPAEIMDVLAKTGEGVGGEIQLTDAIDTLAKNGANMHAVKTEGHWFDCGDMNGYMDALRFVTAKPVVVVREPAPETRL
jgi:UTP--glucose-1-phosphate uridylyltransferase